MATGLRQPSKRERELVGEYAVQHGMVRGLDVPIADDTGGIGMPLVRVPLIARLEHKGTITRREAEAGAMFHQLFQRASLDDLKSPDLSRAPATAGYREAEISASGERCRRAVSAAMTALGGAGSPAASAIWNVVGLEQSVRRWAIATRRPEALACGILIGALGVLAAHFAGGRRAVNR
jgi:hypothetical protein